MTLPLMIGLGAAVSLKLVFAVVLKLKANSTLSELEIRVSPNIRVRVEVDGDAVRRADLVLPAVAAADVPGGVVLGAHARPQLLVDLARELGVGGLRRVVSGREPGRVGVLGVE